MTFSFRPAIRENVGLLIGLIGASGSGKTYTAMRLASGICAGKPFAVIDTEAGRAKHYADQFKFDHGDLKPPFRPDAYAEAIMAADKAGYPVVVVDSCSHEWAGDGGVIDWQDDELNRMAGDDYAKRERVKMAAWIKPKMGHKAMIQKLLQVRAHLILCFRAEEKIEMVKVNGKTEIVKKEGATGLDGWFPVCEKNMPYELTASFLLMAKAPGIPHPIKLQEQHRALFPLSEQITEESGRRLAAWAAGGKESRPPASMEREAVPPLSAPSKDAVDPGTSSNADLQVPLRTQGGPAGLPPSPTPAGPATLTPDDVVQLETALQDCGMPIEEFKAAAKIARLSDLPLPRFAGAMDWIAKHGRTSA